MTKSVLFYVLCAFLWYDSVGQTVAGRVVDRVNNEPLIGALVISGKDTTVSDPNGRFLLAGQLPVNIQIQYLGYQTESFTLSSNEAIVGLTPSATELGAVIVSAGARSRSVFTSPTSINIVDKTLLKRDAPFTTTAAINRVPGVYLHSGTLNTNRLTIRGIGSRSLYGTNKIKAYFDEIPLTDGSGNSTIEDIDQNFIDRIEVIKGPNSSIYGAGLGGVIRLFSHRPASLQTSANLSHTIGSYGTNRFTALVDHSDGKNQLSAGFSDFRSDGYRENSEYTKQQAGLTARTTINARSSISSLVQFTRLKAYIPSSINEDDFNNNPQSAAYTWGQSKGYESYDKGLLGLTYSQQFSPSVGAKLAVFGKFRDAYEPRPFNILQEKTNTVGTRFIISKNWLSTRLHAGGELFHDRYDWQTFENNYTAETNGSVQGNIITDNREKRNYQNIFLELEQDLTANLQLTGGVNANFTSYELISEYQLDGSDASGDYSFDPIFSPKIGLSYQLDRQAVFVNVSHGFSPPSLEETLYPDGQINPNIQPETGWNFETGIRGNAGQLSYDVSVYYMHIQNLLVAQRTAEDAYIGVNAGTNNHLGADILANYSIPLGKASSLNLFYSGSLMYFRFGEFTNDGQVYDDNQLTGVPQHLSNAGIELVSKQGFYGNLNLQYVGEIPMNDENSLYSDPYLLLRSRLGYQWILGVFTVDLYAGVDNIANTKYASMLLINATGFGGAAPRYYYPGLPRNYYSGLKVSYTF